MEKEIHELSILTGTLITLLLMIVSTWFITTLQTAPIYLQAVSVGVIGSFSLVMIAIGIKFNKLKERCK